MENVVGEIDGHDNILSVARMNRAVVLFLQTVDLANEMVESGVRVDGVDDILTLYGKLVSPIKKIAIVSKSPPVKHVSFRQFVCLYETEG